MKKIIALFALAMLVAGTAFAETSINVNGSTTVLRDGEDEVDEARVCWGESE